MAGATANTASGIVNIDALLGLFRWNSLNLTYNFPDAASYYNAATYFTAGTVPSNPTHDFASFAPATASLQSAITHVITTQLMAVAPLNYTLTAVGDPAADSSFAMADLFIDAELGTAPGGVGFYPGGVDRGGDAWFNVNQARFNDVNVGDSAYWVVLHELGHALGLKHGHETGPADQRIRPTTQLDGILGDDLPPLCRRRRRGNDNEDGGFAQTLMMYDIAALQYMYGADYTTNAGNTV